MPFINIQKIIKIQTINKATISINTSHITHLITCPSTMTVEVYLLNCVVIYFCSEFSDYKIYDTQYALLKEDNFTKLVSQLDNI